MYERLGQFRRQVFSDLERYRQVKGPGKCERCREVCGYELIVRDLKQFTVNVFTVEANRVSDAKFPKRSKPSPHTATHIDNTLDADGLKHKRYDDRRGALRPAAKSVIELIRVNGVRHGVVHRSEEHTSELQ